MGYIYRGNYLHLSSLLIPLIEYMQNLLQPQLNRQETFQIIQTFFRSPGHFPYHLDTFFRLFRHFLDHSETFSRFIRHFLDRQETFQIIRTLFRLSGPDTFQMIQTLFFIIQTLSISSGHIF